MYSFFSKIILIAIQIKNKVIIILAKYNEFCQIHLATLPLPVKRFTSSKKVPARGFMADCNILANKITIHLEIKTNNLGINESRVSIGATSIRQIVIPSTAAVQSGHQS